MKFFSLALVLGLIGCAKSEYKDPNLEAQVASEVLTPLPDFPQNISPWEEYGAAEEVWMSFGGPQCYTEEELIAGIWNDYKTTPNQAKNLVASGYEFVQAAKTISEHVKVRMFLHPKCEELAKPLREANILFETTTVDRIWMRDFGPLWVKGGNNASFISLDLPYFHGEDWAQISDQFPSSISASYRIPSINVPSPEYALQGGDFQANEDGTCFYNSPIYTPYEVASLEKRLKAFPIILKAIGCKKQVALEPLPKDSTGHIDMAVMTGSDKRAIVMKFDATLYPEAQAVMERNYKILEAEGYKLFYVPGQSKPDADKPDEISYLSYANSLISGDVAFVPQFDVATDAEAIKSYEAAGYKVVPIRTPRMIFLGGTLHCITAKSPWKF